MVKLTMRPIEIGSGFAPSYPATVVPLHASVSVPVSAACAMVDKPAAKIIAATGFMTAPHRQHQPSLIGWSRQPAADETRVAFQNRKIVFEIDLAEISFDHLLGKRETFCLDLLPAQQFARGAVALRAAILLEMVGSHPGMLGSPPGTAQPGRWETGGGRVRNSLA